MGEVSAWAHNLSSAHLRHQSENQRSEEQPSQGPLGCGQFTGSPDGSAPAGVTGQSIKCQEMGPILSSLHGHAEWFFDSDSDCLAFHRFFQFSEHILKQVAGPVN